MPIKRKNANPRGAVSIAIGELMPKVKQVAEQEKRSVNKQIEVIIADWIESHQKQSPRSAA